ncbi:D-glutamate cyclase, mitochondrial isoform X2 [Colossoma macropomum]|uniref:D-glutamate cyclase, mitochondrial isoform X2 n=1 Tax=Colossoma macropomum TaxID=42526 RepID=UPI001864CD84|nr:D-glutamate cyclase, mitochondrial isoform X2 [Colossoma macropomum]XP_036448747.1 D-glutamate cyclase, mitochondrial isoform X2 [Colossoma macropomum]
MKRFLPSYTKVTTGLEYFRGFRANFGSGYLQANVVILHKDLADDFEAFCHANRSPLPLLYRSKPGEWGCPPLAAQADIRDDCPQYCVFEKGVLVSKVASLAPYTAQLQDMVTFYLGCSFSFEQALEKAGVPVRNLEQGRNVSMFKTSMPCVKAGPFHGPMVVSMRPVPQDKLDAAAQCTHQIPLAHGGPVHIGHPALLGIKDLSQPDYGDPVELSAGDVPVFWACGVTGAEAVQSTKPALAFTHSPGCMFLTDREEATVSHQASESEECPLTFCVSQNPLHYSVASKMAVQRVRAIEELIGEDPGQRGIRALFVQDELLKACLSLSHSSSVLITTGFPTHYMHDPPEETDGPPGAIAMAAMLQALNKCVVIVSDQRALEMNRRIMQDAVDRGVIKSAVPMMSFESSGPDSALRFLCHDGDPSKPRYDHLVAIERSGRASDGNYYNMRGVNIKHLVDPIDDLFTTASAVPGITTTGIGDGGNELGMGKLKEAVKAYMPNGSLIACDVAADFAITAGVSNWGGYAVACALYILNLCSIHRHYVQKGLGLLPTPEQRSLWAASLPSVAKEEEMLHILVKYGVRSGKTANLGLEVDGLTFHPTHSDVIRRLSDLSMEKLHQE